MATTNFSAGTVIASTWLNDVDEFVYSQRSIVRPETFGCIGDGTTDDTTNFQAFLTYLAANGGTGLMDKKTYLITSALILTSPAKGFVLRGCGPETVIRQRTTTAVTCLSIVSPNKIVMEDFKIDCGYDVTGFASHGISMRNANKVVCRNLEIYNHRNTAILTFVDVDDTYGDCHFINCLSESVAQGQNGFLHEGMLRSSIQNCVVKALDPAGSPCMGLQIKNKSKHCWIIGGYAEGCKGGVAMGGDGATFGDGPFNCTIRDVITKDCLDGAIVGKTTDCHVEVDADMTNSPAPGTLTGYALNVTGSNRYLSAVMRIKGVQSGRTCILIRSSDTSVYVRYVNGIGSKLFELSAGVDRARLVVQDIADTITNIYDYYTDNSGNSTNELSYLRDLMSIGMTGNNAIYFKVAGKPNNWISYNGTTDTFNFRNNGTDRFSISPVAAIANTFALEDGITAPSTILGKALIYVDTADGDLKVKFGDGTVKTIATDT